ncbi:trihelix transcription factor GTL2-like [Cucumis melo]|uniref:Trihelix transcription factor GTL2-like n=1 Tax=Cucumis melo TaxID=3656 RepID=A0ABM3KHA3_CUCME|nr:trihelix transcription factor GTL2-like [Cucumis melo]
MWLFDLATLADSFLAYLDELSNVNKFQVSKGFLLLRVNEVITMLVVITNEMQKMGYKRSTKKCKEKWENMNKYFKRTIVTGKASIANGKTCPYFQELDILYRNGVVNTGAVFDSTNTGNNSKAEVIILDMGLLVAGTKYRGELEERLKKLIEEIKQSDEIILFIDEPLAKKFGIKVVPTFKILKDKMVVKEVTGAKFNDLVHAIDTVRSS